MHIQQISIKNYRNFMDSTMKFHKGLNVIVGANNSGKTGLLHNNQRALLPCFEAVNNQF